MTSRCGQPDRADALFHQIVGRRAMQVNRQQQGGLRCQPLGDQGGDHARQHVAHAGAAHAGVAGGVDEPFPFGCRADAAGAFQYHQTVKALRDQRRGLNPFLLDVVGGAGQQPRRFGGMGGEDGAALAAFRQFPQVVVDGRAG